jgi:ABC-2 type transport system permease protein
MVRYGSVFRIRFIHALQYRAAVLGEIAARIVWGFMEILAFAAFYRADPGAFPMEFSQTVSYIWMSQILIVLFSVVFADGEMTAAIRDGSVAYELVRPIGLYGRWFCQAAAGRLAFTAHNCVPALLAAMLLVPEPYRMSLPPDAGLFFLFLFSTVLALCVTLAFFMLMLVSLFYTLSHRGVKIIVTAVTTFLSGGVIPLPFFPETVLAFVRLLPFAAMQNMPLRIYSGNIAGEDALRGICFQVFWLIILLVSGQLAMRRALKKVVVQGG